MKFTFISAREQEARGLLARGKLVSAMAPHNAAKGERRYVVEEKPPAHWIKTFLEA